MYLSNLSEEYQHEGQSHQSSFSNINITHENMEKNHKGIMKTHFSQKSLKIYIIHLYV